MKLIKSTYWFLSNTKRAIGLKGLDLNSIYEDLSFINTSVLCMNLREDLTFEDILNSSNHIQGLLDSIELKLKSMIFRDEF